MQIKLPLEKLQQRSIFLATPCYGGVAEGIFTRSVMDLAAVCAKHNIKLVTYFLFNESLITRARSYCADEFLRSDCTHMMFIDSDIGFNAQDVIALLALSGEESEYDVIGGPYPKKVISWEKVKLAVDKGFADENPNNLERFVGDYVFNAKPGTKEIAVNKPAEVLEMGTGFMMIQRRVFEKLDKIYPHLKYKPDHARTANFDGSREIMMYFDCVIDRGYSEQELYDLVDYLAEDSSDTDKAKEKAKALIEKEKNSSKRYLSEDYFFTQNVINADMKVWLCPWMKLQHAGKHVYGGSLADIAQLGASATVDVKDIKKVKKGK